MEHDTLYQDVDEIKRIVQDTQSTQKADHEMLLEHDKYLVRGNGVPSLQEVVRNLKKELSDFITEVREERQKRVALEERQLEIQRVERNKWKWALIGFGFTTIPPILIQALYFWIKLVPLIEQKQNLP
jgi:Zn-dependent M32 family carboxypeptidase